MLLSANVFEGVSNIPLHGKVKVRKDGVKKSHKLECMLRNEKIMSSSSKTKLPIRFFCSKLIPSDADIGP